LIGVLAIQGDFAAHGRILSQLNEPWREIRNPTELSGIDGLIIPGGESTTILNFLLAEDWMPRLSEFAASGGSIFGTCAGAILLARDIYNPTQPSLGFADVAIVRNAYGRQIHSFVAAGPSVFGGADLEFVFIRAPRIERTGSHSKILAEFQGSPVLVQDGKHLLATFHPELTNDVRVHQHFLSMVRR
jgi:pyridoxal 5'-phosphate synthase pdxT subunit